MNFHRLLIASALFLTAVCMNLYLPGFSEKVLPEVYAWIDRSDFVLPLPEEALAWLVWH